MSRHEADTMGSGRGGNGGSFGKPKFGTKPSFGGGFRKPKFGRRSNEQSNRQSGEK